MPSTTQASNAEDRAEFQGEYKDGCDLLNEDPNEQIPTAIQQFQNHIDILEHDAAAGLLDASSENINKEDLSVPNDNVEEHEGDKSLQEREATPAPQVKIELDSEPETENTNDEEIKSVPVAPTASTSNSAHLPKMSSRLPSVEHLAQAANLVHFRQGLSRLPTSSEERTRELCKPIGEKEAGSDELHRKLHGRGLSENEKAQKRGHDEPGQGYDEEDDMKVMPFKKMKYMESRVSCTAGASPTSSQSLESGTNPSQDIEHPALGISGERSSTLRALRQHAQEATQRQMDTIRERWVNNRGRGADRRKRDA